MGAVGCVEAAQLKLGGSGGKRDRATAKMSSELAELVLGVEPNVPSLGNSLAGLARPGGWAAWLTPEAED